MNQTVLYWLCGVGYAETMAVSLYHLRKHWSGRVVIAHAIDCPHAEANTQAARLLAATFDASLIPTELPKCRRRRHYIAKASLWRHLSGQVVYLDADTVPVAPIDEIFTDSLTVTQFSNWLTTGKRIYGRMQAFCKKAGVGNLYTNDQLPAINTGVVAWGEQAEESGVLGRWETATRIGWDAPFTDELAMQYELPFLLKEQAIKVKIVDDSWNHSPTYGETKPVKIWHFHGRRHIRKPEGREVWRPLALDALRNVPRLTEWWGHFDPAVLKATALAATPA